MKNILVSFIGNLFCWFAGFYFGRNAGFQRHRAYVILYKNGDSELHAKTIGDDLMMMASIMMHLEKEGYDMNGVSKALSEAMTAGNPLHRKESEETNGE